MEKVTALFRDVQSKLPTSSAGLKEHIFLTVYSICGVLAVFIPVIHWNSKKKEFYQTYGYYIEYENQQREYDENQDDGKNNNNNGYSTCHWWQWGCRKQQYYYMNQNGDGNNDDNNIELPGWFRFLGGHSEEEERFYEENNLEAPGTGAMRFVYSWYLIMFIGLLAFGGYIIFKKSPSLGLLVTLMAVFAQFSILMMVLLVQGAISTDDRDLEESPYGWYGQTGVLMIYSSFWSFLYCLGFGIALVIRARLAARNENEKEEISEEAATEENASTQYASLS
jgi:hypothetical protein